MRIISSTIAAALLAVMTFDASATTLSPVTGAAKPQSTFELIKAKKMSMKKKGKKAKKGMKMARPGKCGMGKYYSKGKCMSAADKKDKK